MAITRAKRLIYQGTCEAGNVRCGDFFAEVPARDLDAGDIADLSDEQYAQITGAHPTLGPLYVSADTEKKPAKGDGGA